MEDREVETIWAGLVAMARRGNPVALPWVLDALRNPEEPFRALARAAEGLLDELEAPTEEGRRRYPPDGRYDGKPCVCTEECRRRYPEEEEPCLRPGCDCRACDAMESDRMDAGDW